MPSVYLPSFDRGRVTALVELGGVSGDASLKRRHDTQAPVRDGVLPLEVHTSVVRAIPVATSDSRRVKVGVAVEALVPSQLAQHTAGPVASWNISEVAQNVSGSGVFFRCYCC